MTVPSVLVTDTGGVTIDLRDAELAALEHLTRLLEEVASGAEGAWVEWKPAGLALHTRKVAPDTASELQKVAKARVEAEIPELTVRGGKGVLEFSVRPSDKGEALTRLRQHSGASAVIYVGDDVTDEDAFAALESDDLGVKVGQGRSLAAHRVRSPDDVANLLERLAEAREATHGGPSRWP